MNRYEALKHAVKAHAGQVDKCGQPYILHPIAVADAVEQFETLFVENLIVVALLHDVWEDTSYHLPSAAWGTSAPDLRQTRWDALVAITKRTDEIYADYIERICANGVASIVKLADLWHNLQPERQVCLPEKERKGLEKRYLKARDRIWEALGYEWWPESRS